MKNLAKPIIIAAAIAVSVTFMFAWAPWVTDNYVIDKVVEKFVDQAPSSTTSVKTWQ